MQHHPERRPLSPVTKTGLSTIKQRRHAENLGSGESSVVRAQGLVVELSWVRVRAGVEVDFSSPGSIFCADSYFGIRFHLRVTASST